MLTYFQFFFSMLTPFQFIFSICIYVFPVLFVLILIARITKPHSLVVLNYLQTQLDKRTVSIIFYLVSAIGGAVLSLLLINNDSFYKVLDIAIGGITGLFIASMLQTVIRFLPEYLDDKKD